MGVCVCVCVCVCECVCAMKRNKKKELYDLQSFVCVKVLVSDFSFWIVVLKLLHKARRQTPVAKQRAVCANTCFGQ